MNVSSMESYPVGKENLSSGQGPLTLRKKVLGARDRGATATEQERERSKATALGFLGLGLRHLRRRLTSR